MKTLTTQRKAAPERPARILPRATERQTEISTGSRRKQEPQWSPKEQEWVGCGAQFYFDGCSCSRCEESDARNWLQRRLCEALELSSGYYSPEELEEQLHKVLNRLARWVEQRGYNGQDSVEGRRYAQLCRVLGVAPQMRHSRHYWQLKLRGVVKSLSGRRKANG